MIVEIEFDHHVKTRFEIVDGEIENIEAINGYGDLINDKYIKITYTPTELRDKLLELKGEK